MSEIAKFVSMVSAGVPLRSAEALIDIEKLRSSPVAVLLTDAKMFGSPIAQIGDQLVGFEAEVKRFESELSQAGAVPLQTRKLLLWLPALSLVMGQLSGFGTFSALTSPIGLAAAILAAALILLGMKWSKRMVADLEKPKVHPGLNLMRLGLAVQSGQPLSGCDPHLRSEASELVEIAKHTGAPLGDLIAGEIQNRSTQAQLEAMTQAKQMSVKLLVPMGLTVLPAFFILTIVPMFLGIGF